MFRQTLPSLVVFQNPNLPRVLTKLTPDRFEMIMIALRERKKKVRYMGQALRHFNDRWTMYGVQGTARRGMRFIIERHHTRAQFVHPGSHRNKVDVRAVKMSGAQFDSMGNYTRTTWDQGVYSTNLMNDPTLRKLFRDMPKNETISMMEEWGLKYILLDEIRKPSLVDCKYHRHQIYPNKFSWSPDPETNYFRGDAEYKWKGDELIAYADYNAHVKHPDNFSSSGGAPANKAAATAAKPSPWFKCTVNAKAPAPAAPKATKAATAGSSK